MKFKLTCIAALTAAAGMLAAHPAVAAVSAEEAAQLGGDKLTCTGAERAGNADGSIPAFSGKWLGAPPGLDVSNAHGHDPDPYADEKPLFTITAANLSQYAAKLTEGHKALFKTYPDYKMQVYPTHRSAAVPERIAEATKRIATTATLVPDGNGVTGAVGGSTLGSVSRTS